MILRGRPAPGGLPRGRKETFSKLYPVALHGMLIGLTLAVAGLAVQNRELRGRLPAPPEPRLSAGDELPAVPVRALDGGLESLSFRTAERESLLFIFTTTCPACLANQDSWRETYALLGERYEILGVSLSDLESTRGYRERHALPFPMVVAEDPQAFAVSYRSYEVPLTVHIDRGGEVREAWLGGFPESARLQLATKAAD